MASHGSATAMPPPPSSSASVSSECSCGTAGSAAHGLGGHGQGQKVLFRWTQDAASSVSVVGSWNGWVSHEST